MVPTSQSSFVRFQGATYAETESDVGMLNVTSDNSSSVSNSEEGNIHQDASKDQPSQSEEIMETMELYSQFQGFIETPNGRRYGIEERLGSGGFGVVSKAYSFDDKMYYAMKVVQNKTRDDKRNVAREIAGIKVLNTEIIYTDHIVRYVDSFEDLDKFYMVMEKMSSDLSSLQKNYNSPMSVLFVKIVAKQVLSGLQDIHDAGYVHGDLKLANVMISEEDSEFIIKLIDLGMMTSSSELLSRQGRQFGTKDYWAPEMILGLPLSSKLDIWAVGVMLFELYTGRRLFTTGCPIKMLRAMTQIVGFPGNTQHGKHFDSMFLDQKPVDGNFLWKDQHIGNGIYSWYEHSGFKHLHKYGRNGKEPEPLFETDDFKFEDLLRGMMYPSAYYRYSARQALAHDFFRDY